MVGVVQRGGKTPTASPGTAGQVTQCHHIGPTPPHTGNRLDSHQCQRGTGYQSHHGHGAHPGSPSDTGLPSMPLRNRTTPTNLKNIDREVESVSRSAPTCAQTEKRLLLDPRNWHVHHASVSSLTSGTGMPTTCCHAPSQSKEPPEPLSKLQMDRLEHGEAFTASLNTRTAVLP